MRNNFTRFELYDLITDPGEHDNIFNKSSEMSDIFISKANEYYSAQKAVRKQLLSNTAAVADKPEGEKLERLRALGYLN